MLAKVVASQAQLVTGATNTAAAAAAAVACGPLVDFVTTRSLANRAFTNGATLPRKTGTPSETGVDIFRRKKFPDYESASQKRGSGGRSSFNGITATIFNGTSMVGGHLVAKLARSGTQIVVGYRKTVYNSSKLMIAGDLGQIYFAHYSLKDDESLYDAMRYSNVVVNLVGRKKESSNFSFDDIHVHGPRRMARIARELGVKKFIHFSAMNCTPNPEAFYLKEGSKFLRSKYWGELAVREEFPEAIIIRPADMIGERDDFVNHFASLMRSFHYRRVPLWDYYDGCVKQPVSVMDVVDAVENAIYDDSADGKTFQAIGPYRYDFHNLIEWMRFHAGMGEELNYAITNLRWNPFHRIAFRIMDKVFKQPFITRERIEVDCHTDTVDPNLPTLKDLGIELTDTEALMKHLTYYRPRKVRADDPFDAQRTFPLAKL